MGFISILGHRKLDEQLLKLTTMPGSFLDLNLNFVLEQIQNGWKESSYEKYYYLLPGNIEDIRYRQDACRDLEQDGLYEAVCRFLKDMQKARKFEEYMKESSHPLQRDCWCMDSAWFYSRAVKRLFHEIKECRPMYTAFRDLEHWLEEKTQAEEFENLCQEASNCMEEVSSLQYRMKIYHGRVCIEKIKETADWDKKLDELLHVEEGVLSGLIESPFGSVQKLSYLESMVLDAIEKENREVFAKFHHFYEMHHDFMDEVLLRFEREIQLLISFRIFRRKLESDGFSFCYPDITEQTFLVKGCYDMALAIKNTKEGKKVVPNDLEYKEGEKFFVITGPNQGGKTTFARSIGHVVYFSLLGLPVPASEAKIPFFHNVLTHFATEESVETGSGKLREELLRLSPMMRGDAKHNLILINELFTTATTYDAYIMGNRVMEHFIGLDCLGIYVTHIQELAEEKDGVISLVAEVDERDTHHRTYKMLRQPSVGIGYASDIVEKYEMSYADIKRRLAR